MIEYTFSRIGNRKRKLKSLLIKERENKFKRKLFLSMNRCYKQNSQNGRLPYFNGFIPCDELETDIQYFILKLFNMSDFMSILAITFLSTNTNWYIFYTSLKLVQGVNLQS